MRNRTCGDGVPIEATERGGSGVKNTELEVGWGEAERAPPPAQGETFPPPFPLQGWGARTLGAGGGGAWREPRGVQGRCGRSRGAQLLRERDEPGLIR